jgi:hypothetical protein
MTVGWAVDTIGGFRSNSVHSRMPGHFVGTALREAVTGSRYMDAHRTFAKTSDSGVEIRLTSEV